MRAIAVPLALALVLPQAGCRRAEPPPGEAATPGGPAAGPQAGPPAYVTSAVSLRRERSEAPRVKDPAGKDVSNWVATLQRGERVSVLEPGPDWQRVRASDDKEGWVKTSALLPGEGVTAATVRTPADVFDRPDLLAANAKRKVEPGTLLLVVKEKPPFAEVNVSGTSNVWVLADRLAASENDVAVAKLIEKARWLERNAKHDEAKQILELARSHFPGEPLLEELAAALGEAPPAQGETPPGEAPKGAAPSGSGG
ncbi:MAG TPA: SH3 domain-containing protein [Anaeromyxobacteraceae bacterium]|nr:SH3 domain-containing protein [Anaeromyxobacteraceae bacterium]